jgi:hypothetical protein
MEIDLFARQKLVLDHLIAGLANEILYGGAAAGGKSYLLRAIAIIFAINIPGVQVFLFRRTVKDLKNTHMAGPTSLPMMLSEFVKDKLVNINLSNNYVEFKNNSRVNLSHCQHERDLENYLSAELHVLLIDEATTFTEKMIRFLRGRVRLGSLKVPEEFKLSLPFILYTSNPRGISHAYFSRNFVNASKALTTFTAPENEGGMKRVFIPSLLTDNPFIEPEYANRLKGMGSPEVVKAYLEGDWSVIEGAALKTLSRDIHMVDSKLVSKYWTYKRGYDYGYSAPYAVLFYCIANGESETDWCPPKGSIIIHSNIYGVNDEQKGLEEDVTVTARKIKLVESTLYQDINVQPGPADASIFDKEQGPSIAKQMEDEGISWTKGNKLPGSRVLGLSEVRTLLYNSEKRREEKAGLYFTHECDKLVGRLMVLPLDEKNTEDVDSDADDHDWDVLRYIALDVSSEIKVADVNGT